MLLVSNLFSGFFCPTGACVYHGLLFEVGKLECVNAGEVFENLLLNLTLVPDFCHPCNWDG